MYKFGLDHKLSTNYIIYMKGQVNWVKDRIDTHYPTIYRRDVAWGYA